MKPEYLSVRPWKKRVHHSFNWECCPHPHVRIDLNNKELEKKSKSQIDHLFEDIRKDNWKRRRHWKHTTTKTDEKMAKFKSMSLLKNEKLEKMKAKKKDQTNAENTDEFGFVKRS